MKQLLSLAALLCLVAAAPAQTDRPFWYTTPKVPPRDALERLSLKTAWTHQLVMTGRRDGIVSFQLAPRWKSEDGKAVLATQLLVQTRSGLIVAFDPERGDVLWRTRVGEGFRGAFPLGYNNVAVFVNEGTTVYTMARDKISRDGDAVWQPGQILWKATLEGAPTTGVLADRGRMYVALDASRMAYYDLTVDGPVYVASYNSPSALNLQPSFTPNFLIFPSLEGTVAVLNKGKYLGLSRRYRTAGQIPGGVGVHEADQVVYIASRDLNIYANGLVSSDLNWRHTAGTAPVRAPFVNDEDVYVTFERQGLVRLNRVTMDSKRFDDYLVKRGLVTRGQLEDLAKELGEGAKDPATVLDALQRKKLITQAQKSSVKYRGGEDLWVNPLADRVLAVNRSVVYAADRSGRLLVLDRDRGTELSHYDFSEFVVPITNELTDRLYLAANNGLILCLHDRALPKPEAMKKIPLPGELKLEEPEPMMPKNGGMGMDKK